jgi:PAS domain S-box-containing protein
VATILIVDDRPLNREFLATLLGYVGHRLLEASDGAEALDLVRDQKPDLVITDILMPTMDGLEFVHSLRSYPEVADTRVIFYSAHYLEREARSLAESCGVTYILSKPASPEVVLQTVEAALGMTQPAPHPLSLEEFDREHLRLLTDKLSEKTQELTGVNQRLSALMELNSQLASERDPLLLAEQYCNEAREIIGAKYSAVGILSEDGRTLSHLYASGLDSQTAKRVITSSPCAEALERVITTRNPVRLRGLDLALQQLNSLPGRPPIHSALGGPLTHAARVYGWLALLDKLGAEEFDDADERLTTTFASQLAVAYDNARLYTLARDHATALEHEAVQRRSAEDAQLRLGAILEATPDFVGTADRHERTLYINEAGRKMVGIDNEDVLTLSISDLTPDWAYQLIRSEGMPTAVRQGSWTGETALRHRDGRQIPVSQVILAHKTPGGAVEYFSTVARDISERKRADEALRQAEEKYRSIFENAVEGIFQSTLSGRIMTANRAMARILGYDSPAELTAAFSDDGSHLHVQPEQHAAFIQLLEQRGEAQGIEIQLYRKDGSSIWVSLSARAIQNSAGELIHYEGILEDISERKRLQQQLIQAQKMEGIGRLAGGVAHDFNNLLTAIIGYGQITLADLGDLDRTRSNVAEIIRAGERAASLTTQLLAFSRKQVLQPLVIDLNAIVSTMTKLLERLIGEDIEIITIADPSLGTVRADPGQIEQVLSNLAVNARDAMPHGGKITIETHNVYLDESFAGSQPGAKPGPYVLLAVSDTGGGMDAHVRSLIFEPFFTTKEQGKGTGLGLSTVYGIIKQSGGEILVYSEPGRGATFKVYLPRVDEAVEVTAISDPLKHTAGGSETVLLAEDEELVRHLAVDILEGHGYTVLQASTGEEALRIAQEHEGRIDLLFTDVVMPRMNGKELADRISELHPEVKVLYASGYTDEAIVHLGVLEPGIAFLQKPFTPSSLARKVREVLGEAIDGPSN